MVGTSSTDGRLCLVRRCLGLPTSRYQLPTKTMYIRACPDARNSSPDGAGHHQNAGLEFMSCLRTGTSVLITNTSLICLTWLVWALANPVHAQTKTAHYLFNGRMPAGEIGRAQLARRPELQGFFQPVRIKVPKTSTVSFAEGNGFSTEYPDAALVSLQVGEVYRLQVSYIPNRVGSVYPTIELLDRMHPPAGKETRYPIPIDIAQEDILLALKGHFVTRVIYVEDPRDAVPARDLPEQRYFDVIPAEDPLLVAGELGRPVAILRLGSVVPGSELKPSFLFGSPPIVVHADAPPRTYVPSEYEPQDVPIQPGSSDAVPTVPELKDPEAPDAKGDPATDQPSPSDEDGTESPFEDDPVEPAPAESDPATDDTDDPFGDLDDAPLDDGNADFDDADFDPFDLGSE